MKIYMLWDMEGVSGLYTREQVWHWEAGARSEVFEDGRTLLIPDINSSVQAALDAGVDEVIVADTHSGGGNIRVDRMLDDTRSGAITLLDTETGENHLLASGLKPNGGAEHCHPSFNRRGDMALLTLPRPGKGVQAGAIDLHQVAVWASKVK